MSAERYVKYAVWLVLGGLALWALYVIAGLGSPWVSVGLVGFVALIVLLNRLTRRPSQRTGQSTPKRRVISSDRDRWGGGASL